MTDKKLLHILIIPNKFQYYLVCITFSQNLFYYKIMAEQNILLRHYFIGKSVSNKEEYT